MLAEAPRANMCLAAMCMLLRAGHMRVCCCHVQTHRTQLASGNPSGRAEWNFRCCFALELPNIYDDIKV